MEKMEILTRTRSVEDERSVIVNLTEKGKQMQTDAAKIPDQLTKIFLSEDVKLEDVLQLKEILNNWIEILSKNNK